MERADFPDVGKRRFFVVEHNPKSSKTPVRVELREALVEGRNLKSMSKLLGFENTVADHERIIETAKTIEARVGKIDQVVGIY